MTEAARGASRPLGALAFIRRVRDNPITVYAPEAYERDFSERTVLFQRFALLNHPDYIQRVLVTNHANYGKGRLNRQILGPTLGQGLLTSEGAFWRRQRRNAGWPLSPDSWSRSRRASLPAGSGGGKSTWAAR